MHHSIVTTPPLGFDIMAEGTIADFLRHHIKLVRLIFVKSKLSHESRLPSHVQSDGIIIHWTQSLPHLF